MKDVKQLMQAIDSVLEKQRRIKPEKMDSFICFGADTDGSACIIHRNPGMLQASIINEMAKDEAVATIILQAATVFETIKKQPNKNIES